MNILNVLFAALGAAGIVIIFQAAFAKPRADLIAERLAQYRDHNLTLDEIELSLPFTERFIRPALDRLGSLLTARMAKNRQIVLQNKLNLAGRPLGLTVNAFEVLKYICAFVVAVLVFLLTGVLGMQSLPIRLIGIGLAPETERR